jgi:hypothetical protein
MCKNNYFLENFWSKIKDVKAPIPAPTGMQPLNKPWAVYLDMSIWNISLILVNVNVPRYVIVYPK